MIALGVMSVWWAFTLLLWGGIFLVSFCVRFLGHAMGEAFYHWLWWRRRGRIQAKRNKARIQLQGEFHGSCATEGEAERDPLAVSA